MEVLGQDGKYKGKYSSLQRSIPNLDLKFQIKTYPRDAAQAVIASSRVVGSLPEAPAVTTTFVSITMRYNLSPGANVIKLFTSVIYKFS